MKTFLSLAFALVFAASLSAITLDGGSVTNLNKRVWDSGSVLGGVYLQTSPLETALRSVPGESEQIVVEDVVYLRETGAQTVTDFIWPWVSPTGAGVTRVSSNPAVIIPDPDNATRWRFVSNGTATLQMTPAGGPTYTRAVATSTQTGGTTDTPIGYVDGSLRKYLADRTDSELAGKSATVALDIFTSRNTTTATYSRNANLWTTVDLTGTTANSWGGIVIAPDIVLYAAHAHPSVGSRVDFVDATNTTHSRTITGNYLAPGYAPYYPDWWLAKLSAELPVSINVAKFPPTNWTDYLPLLGWTTAFPTIGLNQFRQATVQEFYSSGNLIGTRPPTDAQRLAFFKGKIGGDSSSPMVMGVNSDTVVWTVWTFGGSGAGTNLVLQRAAIDAGMTALGSAYQTVTSDWSGFSTY